MEKRQRPPRRLQLHRETLLSLTASELGTVAGATGFFGTRSCGTASNPRTNAWTASDPDAGCTASG